MLDIVLSLSACGNESKLSTSQTNGRQLLQDEPSTVQSDTTKSSEESSEESSDNGNSEEDSAEIDAESTEADSAEIDVNMTEADSTGIDVDLTELSSTMIYSEVYNMMVNPEDYVGKMVKMTGQFAVYQDQSTGNLYFAVIIADATAYCSQGLEFILAGNYNYPDDYPEIGTELTVMGKFQTYEENGDMYCHLIDAEIN